MNFNEWIHCIHSFYTMYKISRLYIIIGNVIRECIVRMNINERIHCIYIVYFIMHVFVEWISHVNSFHANTLCAFIVIREFMVHRLQKQPYCNNNFKRNSTCTLNSTRFRKYAHIRPDIVPIDIAFTERRGPSFHESSRFRQPNSTQRIERHWSKFCTFPRIVEFSKVLPD